MSLLSPERWREVSPHLDHALSLSEEERARWLETLLSSNPTLGSLLKELLDGRPALKEERFLEDSPLAPALEPSLQGQPVGAYTLVSPIGRGGMGTVWLAERNDGRFERRVAVKLVHFSVVTEGGAERFRFEGRILGRIAHPNIAELIDAGVMPNGQPYLVIEYVDGEPIDEHCDQRMLDLNARIALFLQLTGAVAHAHANLIVHRDIKPSNVFVGTDGRVKLLDFGIATLLDRDGITAAPTPLTMESGVALTPLFAAPEQVSGGSITTATDVYALGLLFYLLLTGRHPVGTSQRSPAELIKAITESEPVLASEAIASAGAENAAKNRATTPEKLRRQLRGDLDTIAAKALRKDPLQRYASVTAFADDVRRYLAHQPIQARRDTLVYRAAKFVRRNRVSFSAATLALAGILAGSAAALYQAHLARERFRDVRDLAHTFVFDLYDKVAVLEGSTQAREMMVRTGLKYLDDLARTAGGDLNLQREIAAAYVKIGDAEGFPTKPNLGRISDAVASYRKAGAIYRSIAARDPAYLPDLAAYYLRYAGLIRFTHDLGEARQLSRSAIRTFDRMRRQGGLDSRLRGRYIAAWCTAGDMDEDMGHFRAAWTEFSRCGDLARARLEEKRDPRTLFEVGEADERIQSAARELGHLRAALRALDENQAVLDELLAAAPRNPAYHRLQALVYQDRAAAYDSDLTPSLEDPAEALPWAERYLAEAEEMVRSDPANTSARFSRAIAGYEVTLPLRALDARAAMRMASESVRMFDGMMATEQSSYLVRREATRALQHLGDAQLGAGAAREALRSAEMALRRQRRIVAANPVEWQEQSELVLMLILAGRANGANGKFGRAERLLREARSDARKISQRGELTDLIPLADAERALGAFYAGRHRVAQARASYQDLVRVWRSVPRNSRYVDHQRAASARLLASLR